MIRRQPRSTRTDTLFPYTTLFLSRGRGGVAAALASITAPVVVGGVDSDRLYPLRLQEEIADGISTCSGLEILKSKDRSEEHTSELQSLMRISYAVFCLKKKNIQNYKNKRS